jgi:hypothetical protein
MEIKNLIILENKFVVWVLGRKKKVRKREESKKDRRRQNKNNELINIKRTNKLRKKVKNQKNTRIKIFL